MPQPLTFLARLQSILERAQGIFHFSVFSEFILIHSFDKEDFFLLEPRYLLALLFFKAPKSLNFFAFYR